MTSVDFVTRTETGKGSFNTTEYLTSVFVGNLTSDDEVEKLRERVEGKSYMQWEVVSSGKSPNLPTFVQTNVPCTEKEALEFLVYCLVTM